MTPVLFPGLPIGFRYGMDFIWVPERDGNADDSAPGETFLTRWGIIQDTWDDAVKEGIVKGTLQNATQAQCGNIYLAKYWNLMKLDLVPVGIGFMLFVDATLTGVGHVSSLLQRIVGAVDDGIVGDKDTLPKLATYLALHGQNTLVDEFIKADEEYLSTLANAPKFLNGWTRREEALKVRAKAVIADVGTVVTTVAGVGVPVVMKTVLPVPAIPALAPSVFSDGSWLVTVRKMDATVMAALASRGA